MAKHKSKGKHCDQVTSIFSLLFSMAALCIVLLLVYGVIKRKCEGFGDKSEDNSGDKSATASTCVCKCDAGFAPPDCADCVDNHCGATCVTCAAGQKCSASTTSGTCVTDCSTLSNCPGFSAPNTVCSGHGTCS